MSPDAGRTTEPSDAAPGLDPVEHRSRTGDANPSPDGPDRPDGADRAPTRRPGAAFRRLYGAGPLHLVAMLLAVALSVYAVTRILDDPSVVRIALWFVGAALVWDLVLGPAVALADRLLQPLHRVGALNHVRVPLLGSGLLLLVWAPSILQRSEGVVRTKAGLDQDVFLGRWLLITAVLFAVSAALYVLRSRRHRA